MSTRLIKRKVTYLKVGEKRYKNIETLLEITPKRGSVVDYIDLTENKEKSLKERRPAAKSLRLKIPQCSFEESIPIIDLTTPEKSPVYVQPLTCPNTPGYYPASPLWPGQNVDNQLST